MAYNHFLLCILLVWSVISIFTVFRNGLEHLTSRHCGLVTSNLAVAVWYNCYGWFNQTSGCKLHPIKLIGVREAWSSASSTLEILQCLVYKNGMECRIEACQRSTWHLLLDAFQFIFCLHLVLEVSYSEATSKNWFALFVDVGKCHPKQTTQERMLYTPSISASVRAGMFRLYILGHGAC